VDWLIFLFGSGVVFFIGVGFILAGVTLFAFLQHAWLSVPATLLAVIGLLLITLSATPLPYWLYGLAGATTLVWLVAERSQRHGLLTHRNRLRGAVVVLWVVAMVLELPYQLSPTVAASGRPKLYIIGDSVAAGMNDGEKGTWPQLLAQSHPVEVADLSRMGATVASAVRQAENLPPEGGMVLLEIGGNDLLGSATAAEFERDLDRLLGRVCIPGRVVLMFELPLLPFCNDFGRAQRRLASVYGVVLIPKRVFLAVLTGEGATLDSVHLAGGGHERMVATVWSLLRPVYDESDR
jgi:acyl-CoA thioesterase-1